MKKMSDIDIKKMMETVSFELDRDLRLHPQKLELGKIELLTDSLKLPFSNIQKRLKEHALAPRPKETEIIKLEIKAYLKRLNANPLIPLKFRLEVLECIESHLYLFDDSIMTSVMNSHKLGIEMVQDAARKKQAYYPVLVEMICSSLELALDLLSTMLEKYHNPSIMTVRQVLDMARLGLVVTPLADDRELEKRLWKVISHYELLRCMDCYSKPPDIRNIMEQEISNYCKYIKTQLVRKGEPLPEATDSIFLVTNLALPGSKPYKAITLPAEAESDLIVMPISIFLKKIKQDFDRALNVYHHPEKQKDDLHTEKQCHDVIQGVNAIMYSLQKRTRSGGRAFVPGASLLISADAGKAFARINRRGSFISEDGLSSSEKNARWSLVNLSQKGVSVELLSTDIPAFQIGHLVSLTWVGKKSYGPNIGHIRWIREIKHGEWRLGIEFFELACEARRGAILGRSDKVNSRSWHLLVEQNNPNKIWFPEAIINEGMRFVQYIDGKGGIHCHVTQVLETYGNYSIGLIQQDQQSGIMLG